MKRRSRWLLALLAAIVLAVVIGRTVGDRQARRQQAAVAPAISALELGPADLLRLETRELVRIQALSGSLRAVDTALVKARIAGDLRELTVREGDPVRAGQVLGRQDDADQAARLRQAQQQAAAVQAQLAIAERTLADNRALVDQGFISRNALDTSVANVAAARANLLAAQAAADVARKARDDAILRAPIGGQVARRLAQPGERLGLDAPVLEIVDLARMEFEAALPPEALAGIAPGASATLQVDGIAEALPARVARINPAAAPGTRSVSVYLELAPHPALRHGLFATGSIELGRATAAAVPQSALRNDRSQPYLLVIENERVVAHTIKPGARGRDATTGEALVAIEAGVEPGATLLAGSAGIVEDGTPVRIGTPPSGQPR
jgi:RND family efflux transporter MFP subunit